MRSWRLCRSFSDAPGFQRAEIGRVLIVISPVNWRLAVFGGLGARSGFTAGLAPLSPPRALPFLASASLRARDFQRPDRPAAAALSVRSAASLAASCWTAASGSPRPARIRITAAGSAVCCAPDWLWMKSRVRATNARLSSEGSLFRAATKRRFR
jgi:hypothetical protein